MLTSEVALVVPALLEVLVMLPAMLDVSALVVDFIEGVVLVLATATGIEVLAYFSFFNFTWHALPPKYIGSQYLCPPPPPLSCCVPHYYSWSCPPHCC